MHANFYLIFAKGYQHPYFKVRASKKQNASPGEVSIHVAAEIPDALFEKPRLSAKLTIPSNKIPTLEIDTEALEDAIESYMGADLDITVTPAPDS